MGWVGVGCASGKSPIAQPANAPDETGQNDAQKEHRFPARRSVSPAIVCATRAAACGAQEAKPRHSLLGHRKARRDQRKDQDANHQQGRQESAVNIRVVNFVHDRSDQRHDAESGRGHIGGALEQDFLAYQTGHRVRVARQQFSERAGQGVLPAIGQGDFPDAVARRRFGTSSTPRNPARVRRGTVDLHRGERIRARRMPVKEAL